MRLVTNNLSSRLLLGIGSILFVTQGTTIIWLLHEVRELLVRSIEAGHHTNVGQVHFDPLSWEVVGALFFPALIAFSFSLFISWMLIKKVVAPLNRLAQQLQQRNVEQWQPFDGDDHTLEVAEITNALNGLMQKLQLAFSRERQFTADVSHELRTPIAGIRLNLELLELQHPQEVSPLIARLNGMQKTIEQLLSMARLEQKMVMGLQTSVDMVHDVIVPLESELVELLRPRGLTLALQLPDAAFVVGDKTLLGLLLRNLVENSSRYADFNSKMTLTLEHRDSHCILQLMDVGPGVDEAQIMALTNAFQRFDQRGNGVGLGLNIVARVCALHSAKLRISNHAEPHGLKVEISFPLAYKKG